jgi:ubiquinone/menaquinone biosynthesis C-methylase UbiE
MTGQPEHPICALLIDFLMRPLLGLRDRVIPEARGRVVEIGCGTGLNFSRYGAIEALYAVEPDPHMLKRARKRTRGLKFPVQLDQAGAERLPYPDDFFDTAVVTFVLCTIPRPDLALAEVRRVLRPAGQLLYVEHTRSRFGAAARLQDRATPLWKRIGGGCHLNRDSVSLIRSSGFVRLAVEPCGRESWTLLPVYRGTAYKPA